MKCPDCHNGMRAALFFGPDYPCTTKGCVNGEIRDEGPAPAIVKLESLALPPLQVLKARIEPEDIETAQAKGFPLVDPNMGPYMKPGTYNATITKVRDHVSRMGATFVKVDYLVQENGETVSQYITDAHGVSKVCDAAGVFNRTSLSFRDIAEKLEDRTVAVNVEDRQGTEGKFSAVMGVNVAHAPKRPDTFTTEDLQRWGAKFPDAVADIAVTHRDITVTLKPVSITRAQYIRRNLQDHLPAGIRYQVLLPV